MCPSAIWTFMMVPHTTAFTPIVVDASTLPTVAISTGTVRVSEIATRTGAGGPAAAALAAGAAGLLQEAKQPARTARKHNGRPLNPLICLFLQDAGSAARRQCGKRSRLSRLLLRTRRHNGTGPANPFLP
jgi:hypothetical protein